MAEYTIYQGNHTHFDKLKIEAATAEEAVDKLRDHSQNISLDPWDDDQIVFFVMIKGEAQRVAPDIDQVYLVGLCVRFGKEVDPLRKALVHAALMVDHDEEAAQYCLARFLAAERSQCDRNHNPELH